MTYINRYSILYEKPDIMICNPPRQDKLIEKLREENALGVDVDGEIMNFRAASSLPYPDGGRCTTAFYGASLLYSLGTRQEF